MPKDVWHRQTGAVLQGKLVPKDRRRDAAIFASLEGKRVEWCIRVEPKDRTLPQNSKLHVLARLISKHTGDSLLLVKRRATLQALGLEHGIEVYEIGGQVFRDVRPTSALSRPEESAVIRALLEMCSFLELAPPPDENVEVMA